MEIRQHAINDFEGIARINENARPAAAFLKQAVLGLAAYRFQRTTTRRANGEYAVAPFFVSLIKSAVS